MLTEPLGGTGKLRRAGIARATGSTIAGIDAAGARLVEWLAGTECHDLDDAGLAAELGRLLVGAGLPISRLSLHLRTMHPQVLGRAVVWCPGEPVELRERLHDADPANAGTTDPVRIVMETGQPLWVRLDSGDRPDWTESELFGGRHTVEYLALPLPNADGRTNVATFSTDHPGGFPRGSGSLLDRIAPALRNACELRTLRTAELALLQTYVGETTAGRVLAGHVRRGQFENLDAALLLCDLRGFTRTSNTLSGERVLDLLNAYFDRVVPAVTDSGGEVIKFMGDAALAFFPAAEPSKGCVAALAGARKALEGVGGLTIQGVELRAGIALHYGSVGYGNIGSGTRLDFTVIGRDVNLVSRIQGVCSHSGVSLLMSERFARLIPDETTALGGHDLPGFDEPVDLYTLADLDAGLPVPERVPSLAEARAR